MEKRNKEILSFAAAFILSLSFAILFLINPLDKFGGGRSGGSLTEAEAIIAKIVGSCLAITMSIACGFNIYMLCTRSRVRKTGTKRENIRDMERSLLHAVFIFSFISVASYRLVALFWPSSTKDIIFCSLTTNIAGISSLTISLSVGIYAFLTSLKSKK